MIQLISAREIDSELFYLARYSKDAIKYSDVKEIPSYEDHLKWYLKNYKENFFTILSENDAIGYIRINKERLISIAVLPEHQRKKAATNALKILLKKHSKLRAKIHSDNEASIKLFKQFPEIDIMIESERI